MQLTVQCRHLQIRIRVAGSYYGCDKPVQPLVVATIHFQSPLNKAEYPASI